MRISSLIARKAGRYPESFRVCLSFVDEVEWVESDLVLCENISSGQYRLNLSGTYFAHSDPDRREEQPDFISVFHEMGDQDGG